MVRRLLVLMLIGLQFIASVQAIPTVRIKDIVSFEGVRSNQLVGYGLVVGLNGTGDSISSIPYTQESLAGMLERLGVNIRNAEDGKINLSGKNIAAVMVTATMPAFSRHGTHIDVSVSALGDAKDLRGGTLLVTPLLGADGDVYAVAQGAVATNGFNADAKSGSKIIKGVPTSAKIVNGAIVEKEVGFELASMQRMNLSLKNPDFTTAQRISTAINQKFGSLSKATDPTTVSLLIPEQYRADLVTFLTHLEQLNVQPDQPAKIIIDDQDGVIVMGENVRISTIAVTQGSITIKVLENPQVSQPNPFTQVQQATIVDRSEITVKEEQGKMAILQSGISLQELVNGLNALGATPRDLISILRSIKAAGAIQADIEVI
jgi:flagellar P-ring protein precursor FlgI